MAIIKSEDLRQIKYPVIVKPVDSSGGTGIRICHNENELQKAYARAVSLSKTNQAIVEEFIKGDEFTAAYTIKDGQFSLTYIADRYVNRTQRNHSLTTSKYFAIQIYRPVYMKNSTIES